MAYNWMINIFKIWHHYRAAEGFPSDDTLHSSGWYFDLQRMILWSPSDDTLTFNGWYFEVRRMILWKATDDTLKAVGWYFDGRWLKTKIFKNLTLIIIRWWIFVRFLEIFVCLSGSVGCEPCEPCDGYLYNFNIFYKRERALLE